MTSNPHPVPNNPPPAQKKGYKDLIVWQKAVDLAPGVYRLLTKLPKEETFALGAQIRRSVVSVAANIAEGQARGDQSEFSQHLSYAKGSLAELHTQLLIAERLNYFTTSDLTQIESSISEVAKLLHGLLHHLHQPKGAVRGS